MSKDLEIQNQWPVNELHQEAKVWHSELQFIKGECLFIRRLLQSYIFEPDTPNLFERLQVYSKKLEKVENDLEALSAQIEDHENELGEMLESHTLHCDRSCYTKHKDIESSQSEFLSKFRKLKAEIFEYAGAILKKRKP